MSIRIKYLGHSSFLLKIDNKTILTDPYFSNKKIGTLERLISCYKCVEEVPKVDTILISHEHPDAFDKEAVDYLSKKFAPKIVSHYNVLKDINAENYNKISMKDYEKKIINNLTIKSYPAHHPGSFYPLSYLIENKKGKKVFFAGDTFMTRDHDSIKPNIALLPIGGKRTMDVITAIRVTKKMRPEYMIPMHYDTFEDIKRDPKEIIYKFGKNYSDVNTVILNLGKEFRYKC